MPACHLTNPGRSDRNDRFEFLGHPLLNSPNPSPSQDITTTTTNTNTTIPAALSHPPTHYLDWLDYSLPPTSSHTRILNLTYEAFQTASELYSSPPLQTQNTLNRLRALVSQIDPNAPGSHALVWVCFLAAAASTDFSDRSFFTARMGGVYAKTRFRNITVGIDSLPRIWDAQAGARAGEMENDKMSWCNWWNGSGDLGRLASSLVM